MEAAFPYWRARHLWHHPGTLTTEVNSLQSFAPYCCFCRRVFNITSKLFFCWQVQRQKHDAKHDWIDPNAAAEIICVSEASDNADITRRLQQAIRTEASTGKKQFNAILEECARQGNLVLARLLLLAIRNRESSSNALILAAEYGHDQFVKEMKERFGADPTASFATFETWSDGTQAALRRASANGHTKVVKLLLSMEGVSSGSHKGEALKRATLGGHLEIVQALLCRPESKEFIDEALQCASGTGQKELVHELIRNQARDDDGVALKLATKNGAVEVVHILLAMEPHCHGLEAPPFSQAVESGSIEMVELLKSLNTSVKVDYNVLFVDACKFGRLPIVKYLFQLASDPLSLSSFLGALENASDGNSLDILCWLLSQRWDRQVQSFCARSLLSRAVERRAKAIYPELLWRICEAKRVVYPEIYLSGGACRYRHYFRVYDRLFNRLMMQRDTAVRVVIALQSARTYICPDTIPLIAVFLQGNRLHGRTVEEKIQDANDILQSVQVKRGEAVEKKPTRIKWTLGERTGGLKHPMLY